MSDERYVSLAEVRDLMAEEGEKRELYTVQKAARDHAQAVCEISVETATAIAAEVQEVPGITASVAYKIADLVPQYPEDVRAILAKERITLEPAQLDKICDIVTNHL